MKIAVDKNSIQAVTGDNNEYIYLFDNEPYQDLLNTNLHCLRYDYCKFVDINLTNYDVNCIRKSKITDKDYKNLQVQDYKIAIIIPNYNYEHTIGKCLESIFNQTYTNYEIIFVDDMSTDRSVQIASKLYGDYLYSKKDKAKDVALMKIIKLKQKRLNGGARNEAYLHISDDVDYIWYVDSDDWLKDEYVLENINKALQNQPDVLFVGMNMYKNGKESTVFIPRYKEKYDAMQGWSGSCGKVIKKELATRQECLYNEGTLKEDKNQHWKVCLNMNTFECLKLPVYVWNRDNTKSVTTVREKIVWGTSTIRHYADTMQLYLTYKGKDRIVDSLLEERLYKMKQELESGGDRQY